MTQSEVWTTQMDGAIEVLSVTMDDALEQFLRDSELCGKLAAWREEGRKMAAARRSAAVAYASALKVEDWSASSEADSELSTRDFEDDTSSASQSDTEDFEYFYDCRPYSSCVSESGEYGDKHFPPSEKFEDCQGFDSDDEEGCEGDESRHGEIRVTSRDLQMFVNELRLGAEELAEQGWRRMFQRSTARMHYCCWSRDPPPGVTGGTVYRCHMTVLGCNAETARDFFLDEQHRMEWDDNRHSFRELQPWDRRGATVARWVRRFPLFLRDREYVVSRRVWCTQPRVFHCISMATTHRDAPATSNPIRVSSFYSCWSVRPTRMPQGKAGGAKGSRPKAPAQPPLQEATEASASAAEQAAPAFSEAGAAPGPPAEGQQPPEEGAEEAVEIVTIHQEDSGLSRRITRMGVAHGMWTHVLKMEAAMHAYGAAGRSIAHTLPAWVKHPAEAGQQVGA